MKSESIAELAKALCKFQGSVGKTVFDANNPFFNSKYATLSALVDTAKKPLCEAGLSVSQLVETSEDGKILVTTLLMHNSGEFLQTTLTMKPEKMTPQGQGSCITYARRYSFASVLNLVSDTDDDGNEASKQDKNKPQPKQTKPIAKEAPKTEIKQKGNISEVLKQIDFASELILDKIKAQINKREWTNDEELQIINAISKRREVIEKDDLPF